MYPALALIEVRSVARGMVVADALVKKASVELLRASPISPGRYITIFWGPVADVEEAHNEGLSQAGDFLVDHLILPGAHQELRESLLSVSQPSPVDSLGIVETSTIAATLLSADVALKCAEVHLLELRLGAGLDGKGYFILSGPLPNVQAAMEKVESALSPQQRVNLEVIPAPASDFTDFLW